MKVSKKKEARRLRIAHRKAQFDAMRECLAPRNINTKGKTLTQLIDIAERELGIVPPASKTPFSRPKFRLARCLAAMGAEVVTTPPALEPTVNGFYLTYEWRKVRYDVLQKLGGRCCLCGRTARDGIQIHVDHIKPVKKYWALRLEPSNLQVLCNECNHGKGNRDETDWR